MLQVAVVTVALAGAMLPATSAVAQAVTCPTVNPTTGVTSPAPTRGVDWSGCDLQNAALWSFDLTGANFSGADLTGAIFNQSTLTNADLSGANLTGTTFDSAIMTDADLANATVTTDAFYKAALAGTNLTGVDLSATNLLYASSGGISSADAPAALPPNWEFIAGYLVGPNADLDNADLTGADLSGTDLAYVSMNGADLADTNLTGAQMATTYLGAVRSGGIVGQPASLPPNTAVRGGYLIGPGVNLDGANLAGLNLDDLDISQATLTNADLAKAGLAGTNLSGSDLTGADLLGAIFNGTNLLRAILTGDNLTATSLGNSDLALAVLRNVNLTNSSLGGDDLTGADLTGATLTGLISGHITGAPSYLPANWSLSYGYLFGPRAALGGVNLRGDDLFNLDLAGAFLANANLSGADVRGSDLTGARLTNADFANADLAGAEVNATDAYLQGVKWKGAICPNGRKAGSRGCFPSTAVPRRAPRLSLSQRVGVPTSAVHVTGTGFKARERIAIHFGSALLTVGRTSATGVLGPVTVVVPQSAQAGLREITASGTVSGQSASAWFTVETDWAQGQFGPNLDGDNSYENELSPANVKSLHVTWSSSPATQFAFTPAIAGGLAYVATWDGHLYAMNASTGQKSWSWTSQGVLPARLSAPAVAGNTVYLSSAYIYAIGPGGRLEWKFSSGSASAPTVQNGVVYFTNGYVYALNASSGMQLWRADPTSAAKCGGQPAIADSVVYVSCADVLYALDAATGTTLWSYSNNGNDLMAPAVAGGVAYVGETYSDTVHAISTTTHQQLWSYTTGGRIFCTPAVANGTVYVSSYDDNIYALNASTGAKEWSFSEGTDLPGGISPAVANGVVYVTSPNEVVYALDAQKGTVLWSYSNGTLLQSGPVVADGRLYVGTGNGGIYAFSPR
jgi:uncharacterized protein YjbI with pentapeptide repeats/outer membrane protein assembly factor BamB